MSKWTKIAAYVPPGAAAPQFGPLEQLDAIQLYAAIHDKKLRLRGR